MAHLGRPAASIPPSLRAPERRTAIQCWRKPSWIASLALAMTVEGVIVIIPCLQSSPPSSKNHVHFEQSNFALLRTGRLWISAIVGSRCRIFALPKKPFPKKGWATDTTTYPNDVEVHHGVLLIRYGASWHSRRAGHRIRVPRQTSGFRPS